MKYDLKQRTQAEAAFQYLTDLVGKEATVEITKVSPRRTLTQNNYLHLLLSYWGTQTGYSLNESKTIYKRHVNPDIYVYGKGDHKFLRSSSDISKEDMQQSIDRFTKWSAEQGIELPATDNKEFLMWCENQISISKQHL